MKCTIPEISWHNRDPVLSVDIQPNVSSDENKSGKVRLASGGSDSHVLVWYLEHNDCGTIRLDLAADLNRHQRAVNVVRWSPSGELLASGDDESIIFVWKLKSEREPQNILDDVDEEDKEVWLVYKTLRGHLEDVYDLSWSPNSLFLMSGSVDNAAIIWDIKRGRHKAILNDHQGFVQGVAWDPKNQYLATLSTDRFLRLFNAETNKICRRLNKSTYPVSESSPFFNKMIRLFHDDTLQTFYRRFCFTPDGELIIVPSGIAELVGAGNNANDKPINTTYIFSRYSTKRPAVVIPSPDQYTIAVRCCPILFKLRPHDETVPPIINLPYRMIFAVATKSCVYLYDTQQEMPFTLISNIHYARLTDLTWSSDGNILIVSSVDGFCTLITFEEGELGTVFKSAAELYKENEILMDSKLPKNSAKQAKQSGTNNKEKLVENKSLAVESIKTDVLSPKDIKKEINENEASKTETLSPKDSNMEDVEKETPTVVLNIPASIIETTEKFESPENKTKPATPIAIRREPRRTPSSEQTMKLDAAVSEKKTPKSIDKKKATPIAFRRKPRNILPSPVCKSPADHQDEALDAWPIPIDHIKESEPSEPKDLDKCSIHDIENTKTEDMRLVYEGETESDTLNSKPSANNESNRNDNDNTGNDSKNESKGESKTDQNSATCPKTPRRVQLRTISTPKSKKNQST